MSSRKELGSGSTNPSQRETAGGNFVLTCAARPGEQKGIAGAYPSRWRGVFLFALIAAVTAAAAPRDEPSVADLKARIAAASPSDRARLCVQIAQKQADSTGKLYAENDPENARAALTDVVAYSELARDYSIQSHKHQKQTEIAVRAMTRKLTSLLHSLAQEEQGPVKDALQRLDRVRDDLLAAMFKKGPE